MEMVFYFPAVSSGCGWCNHQRTSLKQWKDIKQNCAPVLSLLHSFQVLKWVKSFLCRSICYFKFLISYICCRIDFYLSVSIAYLLSKNHLTNNFIFICRSSHFENYIHGHTTVMKSEYLPIISKDGDFLRKERVLLAVITCEVAYRINSNKRPTPN